MRFAWQIAVDFARKLRRHLPVNRVGGTSSGHLVMHILALHAIMIFSTLWYQIAANDFKRNFLQICGERAKLLAFLENHK